MAESLVLNDSTLIDRAQLVVGGVGDLDPCRPNLDLSIRKLIDIEYLPAYLLLVGVSAKR